jgi:hypothetical protein
MRFDICHQIPQPLARVMAGTQVMHIAKGALDRVGARTRGRQQEPGKAGVLSPPWVDGFRLRNFVVSDHDRNPLDLGGRLGIVQGLHQLSAQRLGLTRSTAVAPGACGRIPCPRQVVILIGPRRHDGQLSACGHPGTTTCDPQVDIQFIGKDHRLPALERLEDIPDAGQPREAVGLMVFGQQCGPLLHPADLVEPAPQRLGGDRDPPLGRQGQGQRGTAPARAAPPVRPRGGFEQGQQRPPECGKQHRGAQRWHEPPLGVVPPAEGTLPRGVHRAVHAGARAEQGRGDVRWSASRGTQQQDVEGQQVAVARTPQRGQHLGVRLRRNIDDSALGHSGVSSLIHGCLATSDVS